MLRSFFVGLPAALVLSAANEYKDVPVVDVNCSKKVAADADSHPRECALKVPDSGFGIVVPHFPMQKEAEARQGFLERADFEKLRAEMTEPCTQL